MNKMKTHHYHWPLVCQHKVSVLIQLISSSIHHSKDSLQQCLTLVMNSPFHCYLNSLTNDARKLSPLHVAAGAHHHYISEEALIVLLCGGAAAGTVSGEGFTALHYYCRL